MASLAAASFVLSHHWLIRYRGGERVLQALGELAPHAPIYALLHNPDFRFQPDEPQREIHTSFLQYIPHATRMHSLLLPLMPAACRNVRLPNCDVVLCSDAAFAKAFQPADASRLICYCHSPPRYLWEPDIERDYAARLPTPLRPLWPALRERLKRFDAHAAAQVDLFVANSQHVAQRIQRAYRRAARVVYPPVALPLQPVRGVREDFLLCVGHHVPYKRLDLAVDVATQLQRPLVVIGDGPDVKRLKRRKTPHITCLDWQPADVIRDHYSRAAALLFPGEEDFGIVPVEAMAHGCPVVAYGFGGATESIVPGVTGELAPHQTLADLTAAAQRALNAHYDPDAMWQAMQRFAKSRFLDEMRTIIAAELA